jgi:hypothetical protein
MAGTEKQREEINRKLVSMQMEMIGLTYEDAMNTPEFWRVYTLTTEQTIEWRKKALPLIRKTFKVNKSRGELIMALFELDLGLREFNPPPTAYLLEKPTFWQKVQKFFIGYYQ